MTLQRSPMPLYAALAGAKSSAGCASPNSNRRNSAHHDGVFLCPSIMVDCAWEASACRIPICPVLHTCVQSATHHVQVIWRTPIK